MKIIFAAVLIGFFTLGNSISQSLEYYELRTYHCHSNDQLDRLEEYLEQVFIPLLINHGLDEIGVYEDLTNDTASQKKIFVLIPADHLAQLEKISDWMMTDVENAEKGKRYLHASHDNPSYHRIEITWLRAFVDMPKLARPKLSGEVAERVFELRSYEGATERLYRRKVDMFNAGGEIELFQSLNFNAVFYAEVLAGSHMPNLMYMTSFDNMAARDAHWDTFRNSPVWKKLKAVDKYRNTVSHADIFLLRPASYSTIK